MVWQLEQGPVTLAEELPGRGSTDPSRICSLSFHQFAPLPNKHKNELVIASSSIFSYPEK